MFGYTKTTQLILSLYLTHQEDQLPYKRLERWKEQCHFQRDYSCSKL